MIISNKTINEFKEHLIKAEKAEATVMKYTHDVMTFFEWLDGDTPAEFAPLRDEASAEGDITPAEFAPLRGEMSPKATKGCSETRPQINKEILLAYKDHLKQKYSAASVNAAIASLNSFLEFAGRYELRLKSVKIQKQIFAVSAREIKQSEYKALLAAAKRRGSRRLYLIMQTICSTGIRISELKYITAEAAKKGIAQIDCKGKHRCVILPEKLCSLLKSYVKEQGIKEGSIFITRHGNPVDRSNIAKEMKRLAELAKVAREKVFPHNLRHLFARVYYTVYKDISRLADILGHSSINTTRIYTRESGAVHRLQLDRLNLIC